MHQLVNKKKMRIFSLYHIPCSSYPAWLHFHNNVRWGIQIMTLFITHFQGQGSVWCFVTWCFFAATTCYIIPPPKFADCPLSAVRGCIFIVVAGAVHIWKQSVFIRIQRKCHTVATHTHVHDFELRHVSAKNDPCCKLTGAQLNIIGTEELASDWRVWGVQKFLRHRVALRNMHFPSFCNQL